MKCHYCASIERDTRPYGPGGADVCYPCMSATPERQETARNAFLGQCDAAEAISPHGTVVIGQGAPEPLI